jgi:hypothetical protein
VTVPRLVQFLKRTIQFLNWRDTGESATVHPAGGPRRTKARRGQAAKIVVLAD